MGCRHIGHVSTCAEHDSHVATWPHGMNVIFFTSSKQITQAVAFDSDFSISFPFSYSLLLVGNFENEFALSQHFELRCDGARGFLWRVWQK
jgi:hypothetical protein